MWLNEVKRTVKHNAKHVIEVELSCDVSSTLSISYALNQLDGNSPPTWAALDAVNSKLILDVPFMTETSEFSFSIDATILGVSGALVKPVYITVTH